MNQQNPKGPRRAIKPGRSRKSVARRRKILLIAAGISLVFLIGVLVWKSTVKPPDLVKPTGGKPDNGPEQGRDYYEGELIKPFVEDGNRTRKEDCYTFLLCGTDEGGARSDTIIVASYDIKNQTLNMVNVPRDTMSNVKRKIKKINSAFYGGVDQLREELQMLLGFRIDRTVVIDFQGFEDLVNAIGGVEFDVPVRMLYTDPTQDLYIDLLPGLQKLDGAHALQLIRFRKNNPGVPGGYPGGDIERIACQQEFLRVVAKKLLNPSSLLKVSDIAGAILENTETDMSMGELMWLGIQALSMKSDSISMSVLPGTARYLWEADYGHMQSYYVPDRDGILEMVNEKLNPYNEPVTELNLIDASSYPTSKPASAQSGGDEDDQPPEQTEPAPETPAPAPETPAPEAPADPEPPAGSETPGVTPETPPDAGQQPGEAPEPPQAPSGETPAEQSGGAEQ